MFTLTSDTGDESQVKRNQAVKLFMLHNEPKVIKQHAQDCIHTFIHVWNHTSKHEEMGTLKCRSKEHLCARDGEAMHIHVSTTFSTYVHSTCTNEHTLYNALGTSHVLHFVACVQRDKQVMQTNIKRAISVTPYNLLHLTNHLYVRASPRQRQS